MENQEFVLLVCHRDEDGPVQYREVLNYHEAIKVISDHFGQQTVTQDMDGLSDEEMIPWMISMVENMQGSYADYCRLLTLESFEQEESERERKEIERTAARFARECGYPVGSSEYIAAAHAELRATQQRNERWNDWECRMESWAECQYGGGRSEVYFDDFNFVNGRFSDRLDQLGRVLQWLEDNCPLLCRKVEEQMKQDDQDEE